MKHKKSYSDENRRSVSFDDLQDCNEQELKKSGWHRREEHAEVETKASAETETETVSLPDTPQPAAPVRKEPKKLPVKQTDAKSPVEKNTDALPSAFAPKEEPSPSVPKAEKQGTPVWHRAVLFGTLMLAVTVLVTALLAGEAYARFATEADGSAETPPQEDSDTLSVSDDGKVVFVRPYDDTSGILTKPEIYAKCADSVVSIRSENGAASGIGSGFILSEDGYIATAYHVVEGMNELTVVLADQSAYPATLIGGDALTDLAVLKIETGALPAVTFGESGKLLTGETVIAIGTPASMDYAGSLCSGEVSYLSRAVKIYDETGKRLTKTMTLIQTDAPVNPGNSGCPLLNEYGQVVGVVTMKLGSNYAGIGFAIPSDGALPILQAMMRGETLDDSLLYAVSTPAPKLGIVGEAAEENGIQGVRILGFSESVDTAAFPLKVGDLIVGIDGYAIRGTADVSAAILQKSPDDTVSVTVLRWEQQLTFDVILGK